jgi:8-oxo-dGTP pyrophosphatase MutT (NUDIX family)
MTEVCAVLVLSDNRRLLLARRTGGDARWLGKWDTPGGKRKSHGENALQCARRELFEEAGIQLPPERFEYWGKKIVEEVPCILHYWAVYLREEEEALLVQVEPDKHGPWIWHDRLAVFNNQIHQQMMPSLAPSGPFELFMMMKTGVPDVQP